MLLTQLTTSVLSVVLSAVLTVGSALGGAMGGFFSLLEKQESGLVQSHVTFSLELDPAALDTIFGETGMANAETLAPFSRLSLTFDSITDNAAGTSFTKMTRVLPDGTVEESEIYLQPDGVAVSPSVAKTVLGDAVLPAYEKYFGERYLVLTAKETAQAIPMIGSLMGKADDDRNALPERTVLAQLLLPCASKYFTEVKKDGATAYRLSLNGNQAFDLYDAMYAQMATPEYLIASANYQTKLTGEAVDLGALQTFQTERIPELRRQIAPYLTGSKEQTEESKALLPLLAFSYVDAVLYEKNGAVCEELTFVLSDGNATFLKLVAASEEKAFSGTVPTIASLPLESRADVEQVMNKAAYEQTHETGVDIIYIGWTTEMTAGELNLSDVYFVVRKENGDTAYENYADSSATIIDSRSYLPLRQLMEYAGYDVSWDPEQRRAYVEVDGAQIEMTGVIVNDRTYVKVRDFEKLGAKVVYDEQMISKTSETDFKKACTAVIAFSPEMKALLEG